MSAVVANQGASAASDAQVSLLRDILDDSAQMMAQLVAGLEASNPPGVGGSVNTYA